VSDSDFLLASPERVLSMVIQGNEAELSIAIARFLELNGYDDLSVAEGRSIFNEVYNNIYAVRVLIRFASVCPV
jgi:hypothetical protein